MTLARFERPTEATRWVRVLQTYAGPAVTAYEVVLVRSWLGQARSGRVRHEAMAAFPLGGRLRAGC